MRWWRFQQVGKDKGAGFSRRFSGAGSFRTRAAGACLSFETKSPAKGEVPARHCCRGTVPLCKSKLRNQNRNRKPEVFRARGHIPPASGPAPAVSFLRALAGGEGAGAAGDQRRLPWHFSSRHTHSPLPHHFSNGSGVPRLPIPKSAGHLSPFSACHRALCGCSLGVKGIAGSEPAPGRWPPCADASLGWGWGWGKENMLGITGIPEIRCLDFTERR